MKRCSRCKILKTTADFGKNKSTNDGLAYYCKECKKALDKGNYALNFNTIRNRVKRYRKECKEKVILSKRKEYAKNREKYIERSKTRYNLKKEEILLKNRVRYQKHKPIRNAKQRFRLKTDLNFRLAANLRSRLSTAIRANVKSGSAVRDLGCSIDQLKRYLESLFQPGMSWENYGRNGWHIDHIIPLDSFDLTQKDQLLRACHYTNLQPLWAKDNIKKGNKT